MERLANSTRRMLVKGIAAATLVRAGAVAGQAMEKSPDKSQGLARTNALTRQLARRIPSTGEPIPAIGLGTYETFDLDDGAQQVQAKETLRLFASNGGAVVDSSPMYGRSESVVGALSVELGLAGKLFLATKVWTTGRDAGIRQMDESFKRLHTQRMDLMQIHNLVDADTHASTLLAWKQAGRIRYWGVSHYHRGAYAELERFIRARRPDFLQINYSIAEPESGLRLLPLARELGVAVIANRPFAQGDLFRRVAGRALPDWAAEFDAASWAQFFLKWILADPTVTCVIPATRKPKNLLDNMGAGQGKVPDAAARAKMAALLRTL